MRAITTRTLMGFLIVVMISFILRLGTYEILIKRLKTDSFFTRAVFFDTNEFSENVQNNENLFPPINFREKYPFTTNKKPLVDTSSVIVEDERTEEFDSNTLIGRLKNHLDFFLRERLVLYDAAVDLAFYYEAGINWSLNENAILVGKNYWVLPASRKLPVHGVVASTNDFYGFLQTKNIPLLYVAIPNKLSSDSTYLVVNQEDIDKDFVLGELRKNNISMLDLRENIRVENKNWHSLFYNTDHHWRAETGLWASKIIAEKLNAHFAFDFDTELLNTKNFNNKLYKNFFLGSIGQKVGHMLAKPDDFILITPNFETKFYVLYAASRMNYTEKYENADWETAFIAHSRLETKISYSENAYNAYMKGWQRNTFISNKLNSNGKKILIIGDSNARVVVPFVAILTESVIYIEPRQFNGSIETLVGKEKPDIVILMYNRVSGGKLFDFR